ncbi:MAG TPA: hypothetical protein VFZ22_17315 [Pyrinomonadaceae bacterium]|nr:hypothetical protein [Pyrinomonadaceae bacterium]
MSKPATTIDLAAFKKQLADSLERSAKSAGQTIVKESLTCEMAIGVQVVTAAIQRDDLPTEKEITAGVDLLYAYVSIDGQRALPAGHYRVRVALPGYEKKGDVKVSFIDAKGQLVHSLTGKGRPRPLKPGAADDVNITIRTTRCGRKKCFTITRNGFRDWEWGCTDLNGNTINCLDRQP